MKKWTKAIVAVAAGAMLIPLAACGSTLAAAPALVAPKTLRT